jgi:hypothetical protein
MPEMFFTEKGELKEGDFLDTDIGELPNQEANPRFREFQVSKPQKVRDTIMYEVSGYTKEGPFREMKRYSDFDKLRECLAKRWPGFYIPALPPKAMIVSFATNLIGKHGSRVYQSSNAIARLLHQVDRQNALPVRVV